MRARRLGPDLPQAHLVEPVVHASSPGETSKPSTPPVYSANDKAELPSARLVAMKVNVADQQAVNDRPQPCQFGRRALDERLMEALSLGEGERASAASSSPGSS